jgi:hypothetical protein
MGFRLYRFDKAEAGGGGIIRTREYHKSCRLIFRSYQLLFSRFNHTFSRFIGVAYVLVNTILITFIYEIILYSSEIHVFIFLLGMIILDLTICTGFLYQMALRVRESSVQVVSSYQSSGKPHRSADTAFWKSCYLLEVSVGGLFKITSKNFNLYVFCKVVLNTSIDLILAFPKSRQASE